VKAEVRKYTGLQELSLAAAECVLHSARQAAKERGRFLLVLSGGETPRRLYELLAQPPCLQLIPWKQVHLFWGDERCVAPDHAASNYGLAKKALLDRVPIPAAQIHRLQGELPPDQAVRQYLKVLHQYFPPAQFAAPVFDLVLLGMGADGHTASLFPGHRALEERQAWVAAVTAPEVSPVKNRLTLTVPAFNGARRVLFLISGKGKMKVAETVLDQQGNAASPYPAARIDPAGSLLWFIDQLSP
jgi:6-phosphogluconolactonase